MRAELESKLLLLAPAEILAAGPLSSPTRRLLGSFTNGGGGGSSSGGAAGSTAAAGAVRGGGGSSGSGGAVRLETVDGSRYLDGGALAAAIQFYGENGEEAVVGQAGGSQSEVGPISNSGGGGSVAGAVAEGAVNSVMRLPPLVLRALAHALDYLAPLGVEGVLRVGAAFRELGAAQELALGPNTLRWVGALCMLRTLRMSGGAGTELNIVLPCS